MRKFLTHKLLPVLAVFLLCTFLFCVFSFGVLGDYNCDLSTLAQEEKTYIKECFDYVEQYCKSNSISYNYYFIFAWKYEYDFMNTDTLAIIVGDSVKFHTGNGGCLNSYGNQFTHFYFHQNSDVEISTFSLDSAYDHIYIYYTNFSDSNVVANDIKNEVFFSVDILEIDYDYKYCEAVTNNFSLSESNRYLCYYSTNNVDWILMDKVEDESFNNYVYYTKIYFDGTYYFKMHDNTTGLDYFDTKEVTGMFFQINVSETGPTEEPILAYTNVFTYNGPGSDFAVQVSRDKSNWTLLDFEWVHWDHEDMNQSTYRDTTYIYENGTYYFRFFRFIENDEIEEFFYTLVVENMTVDWNDPYFVPTPTIYLDYDETDASFIVRTQYILQDKALTLKCLYTDLLDNEDYTTWNEMNYEIMSSSYTDYSEWYFYFKIPVLGAEDKSYKIAFYAYAVDELGTVITYEFKYEEALDYVENELGKDLGFSVKINTTLLWLKSRLGFLVYPFEFVADVGSRILSINFEEPVINVPELREPFYNQKLLDPINYNMNSLLENETFSFMHSMYLISVDFIIIVSLIFLAYKVVMEVFSK